MTLLTEAEARTHITTPLVSAALMRLLDAAEATITDAIGPVGVVTEYQTAGPGDIIMLSHRASAVTSVKERETTLNANDYEILGSGRVLHRLHTGANPQWGWYGQLVITYTPVSDLARRKVAQLALVNLDLDFNPAAASERIGDWTETFRTDTSYIRSRDDILASLIHGLVML